MPIVEVHLYQLKFCYSCLTRIFVDLVMEGRVEHHTFSVLRIAEDRMANLCARHTHLSRSLPYSVLKGNSPSKQDRKRERFDSGRRTQCRKSIVCFGFGFGAALCAFASSKRGLRPLAALNCEVTRGMKHCTAKQRESASRH
jgi:hypothetical protein